MEAAQRQLPRARPLMLVQACAVRLAKPLVSNSGQTRCLRAETTGGEGARLALTRQESAIVCVCVCVWPSMCCSQERLAVRAVSDLFRPLLGPCGVYFGELAAWFCQLPRR